MTVLVKTFGFPNRLKLTKTDEFSSVFSFRKRISGEFLAFHYLPNDKLTARLGLMVGKKQAKLSVDRNYMKRVLRECFRAYQQHLQPVDLVVRIQKPFNKQQFVLIKKEFEVLATRLTKRLGE